jgi:hypothetical protein
MPTRPHWHPESLLSITRATLALGDSATSGSVPLRDARINGCPSQNRRNRGELASPLRPSLPLVTPMPRTRKSSQHLSHAQTTPAPARYLDVLSVEVVGWGTACERCARSSSVRVDFNFCNTFYMIRFHVHVHLRARTRASASYLCMSASPRGG